MHLHPLFPAAALTLALASCSRPTPPTLVPAEVRVVDATTAALDLDVRLKATNPNSFDLESENVSARVVLDGKVHLPEIQVPVAIKLPAGQTSDLDVKVDVPWAEMAPLAQLAMGARDIPYTVDGTVGLGGDTLHVEVPYHFDAKVSPSDIRKAVMNSVGIPGLLR